MTERQQDQRDYRTDVLLRFMDQMKNLEVLGGKSVEAAFSSEQVTRDTLQHLDKEAFVNLLQGVNGILREFPQHQTIDLDTLFPTLTSKEIESILETYGELKADQVRLLMDSIEHPEKEEYIETKKQSR